MSEIEQEAIKLFRWFHGPGDSGSEIEFHAQNPASIDGWMRLARLVRSLRHSIISAKRHHRKSVDFYENYLKEQKGPR